MSLVEWSAPWTACARLAGLPARLLRIHRIVREEYAPVVLDANLASFHAYVTGDPDRRHAMRPWQKASPARVSAADVVGLTPRRFADVLLVAMEIELPIRQYTRESGEGLAVLIPSLARYMGMSRAEAALTAENGDDWCQAPWCAEERRHATVFAKTIERLTGFPAPQDNPTEVDVVTPDIDDATEHLTARMTTEWCASSAYLALTAHADGDLRGILENVLRDEVKHLAITSAAWRWLNGPAPWRRFAAMLRKVGELGVYHRRTRTTGGAMTDDPIAVIETVAAFLVSEAYVRRWLRSLSSHELAWFEATPTPSQVRHRRAA